MAPDANGPRNVFDISGPQPQPTGRPEFAREPIAPAPDPAIRGVGFESPRPVGGTQIPINNSPAVAVPPATPPMSAATPPPAQPPLHPPAPKRGGFGGLFGGKGIIPKPPVPPHPTMPKKPTSSKLWLYILIVILAVSGLYLAADAGAIRGGSHLPYHLFSKYKKTAASSTNTANSNVPAGFTLYKLADAGVEFDAPTAWGVPTSQTDLGYSKRGGSNKSDGTHAFVVSFAQNKKVQLALTSGTLLSASKNDNRYFDDLQWCVGALDKKIYLQKIAFTTTAGIDTPATVVCAQGPLNNATQLDASTIEITNVKAVDGSKLGNVYVKNLSGNSNAVVLRALDSSSSNDSDIRTLLGTVQNL